MIATSPTLALMIVVLMPLVVGPLLFLGRRVRRLSRDSLDRVADASALAGETINAVQTVQAFTLEDLQTRRFRDAVEQSFLVAVRRIRIRGLLTALATTLVFGAITLVLWIGAHQVLAGDLTFGQLTQFLLFAGYMGIAAASLSEMWGEVQRAAGAMERLVELEQAVPTIQAPPLPLTFPTPSRGYIRFDGVTFRYPSRPDTAALDDFSVTVEPGETVAFVGPSGAGKTTTFQLLLRFYDPAVGRILIDGVDIAKARPEDVRGLVGLVPQDTVLFGASARENIRYGRADATDAEIEAAARAAAADEFIRELPQGYDTFLGERGTRLSGGQRQRIAIARAILKNPPILLLDEATSSLDAHSERLVQLALERLMKARTTIIIAHRLATVLKADRIIVMNQGRVVASGSHAQLLLEEPAVRTLRRAAVRRAKRCATARGRGRCNCGRLRAIGSGSTAARCSATCRARCGRSGSRRTKQNRVDLALSLPSCHRSRRQDCAVRDRHRRVFRAEAARALRRRRKTSMCCSSRCARAVSRHDDVDAVVLSHLHFDHAGGLLGEFSEGRESELLFPNAHYVVGERAWERACKPHPRDRASFIPRLTERLAASGRLELVSGGRSRTLGDRVRFHFSDGHTPGLMHAEVGGIVFCSDLIPGRPWVHLPVTMGYDRNPELLIDEKRAFLEDKIARGVQLFFTHDLGCAVAAPTRDASGRFGVASEQRSLDGGSR